VVNHVLGLVLPLCLGAAVSPTLITIVLLILAGKADRIPRAWGFTTGVAVVTAAAITLFATVWANVDLGSVHPSTTSRIVHAVLAVGLGALGIHALVREQLNGSHPSRAQRRMKGAKPPLFLGMGAVAMATNFSSLVLMVAATHEITKDLHGTDRLPLLTFLFLCAIAPVLLPTLAATLMGPRADPVLDRLNRFIARRSRQINAGICFLFAVLLGLDALK
jgi:hypothetical protein